MSIGVQLADGYLLVSFEKTKSANHLDIEIKPARRRAQVLRLTWVDNHEMTIDTLLRILGTKFLKKQRELLCKTPST